MKRAILTLSCSMVLFLGFSQSPNYMKVMKENIEAMDHAEDVESMQQLANQFERIADAEKNLWLPYYYAAFCHSLLTYLGLETDMIDQQLDQAEKLLEKARHLDAENDEIEVLQGFIYQCRIQVEPMSRGYQYSMQANGAFNKAKMINPDNPRVYYLLGQSIYYTPEEYGGGEDAACPYFKTAAEKFQAYQPESEISPVWGAQWNEDLVARCEQ